MNEEDLRDCFAMVAMVGLMFRENYEARCLAELAYHQADKMMEARKPQEEAGIAAIKPRTRRKA